MHILQFEMEGTWYFIVRCKYIRHMLTLEPSKIVARISDCPWISPHHWARPQNLGLHADAGSCSIKEKIHILNTYYCYGFGPYGYDGYEIL